MQAESVTTTSGLVVVSKRKPSECKLINYNPHAMLDWQANMDVARLSIRPGRPQYHTVESKTELCSIVYLLLEK